MKDLRGKAILCCISLGILLAGGAVAWQIIRQAAADAGDAMLFSLHLRADSLAWAAEGAARHLGGHDRGDVSRFLREIIRQPGVAWIAVVDCASGRILIDSNPELQGSVLYTPAELTALAPGANLQGRFSPDDPQVYEMWRLFRPWRMRKRDKHHAKEEIAAAIFVALDVSCFQNDLKNYQRQLWIIAVLLLLCLSSAAILLLLIRNDRISRQKLQEADERLTDLRNLAAGVAHEIRNPLSSICGYAAYLKAKLDADPLGKTTAALLEEESQRLNSALCDLLNLVKKPNLRLRQVSPRDLLGKICDLLKPDADAKGITLKADLPLETLNLRADGDRLLQALLNLAINAIQAAPQNGVVEIGAQLLTKAEIPSGINAAKRVWKFSVEDNGPGLTEEALRQAFKPYFTTKAEGTGLGLAIVRQIAEAHGGAVFAANIRGKGASFSMFIPDAEGAR